MDGLQLVRTLRGQGASMPILMLSSESSVAAVAQQAGATAFLSKPLAIGSFSQFLHTLLPEDAETRARGQSGMLQALTGKGIQNTRSPKPEYQPSGGVQIIRMHDPSWHALCFTIGIQMTLLSATRQVLR